MKTPYLPSWPHWNEIIPGMVRQLSWLSSSFKDWLTRLQAWKSKR
ncbi:hypothetical protein ACVWY5_001558 [Bradyrhizobium sp. USDA 3256]